MVVGHVGHQLEGTGPGSLLVEVVLGGEVVGDDGRVPGRRHHAEDWSEWLFEAHAHRVAVERLDARDGAELGGPGRRELRIEQALEGVDDVLCLELAPVVEHHSFAQREGDRERVVGHLVARGEARQQVAVPVEDQEGVVDLIEDQARRVLGVRAGGEVCRLRCERNREGAAPDRALLVGRGDGEQGSRRRHHGKKGQRPGRRRGVQSPDIHLVTPRDCIRVRAGRAVRAPVWTWPRPAIARATLAELRGAGQGGDGLSSLSPPSTFTMRAQRPRVTPAASVT